MAEKHALVGRWFHTWEKDELAWQGTVEAEILPGWYLVQLFEWFHGEPSVQRVVRIEEMTGWHLYPSREDMLAAYEVYDRRRATRREVNG